MDYERIWRAMHDHRLMELPERPGTTYADVCTCRTAIYSTPHYYAHIYAVAVALHDNPNLEHVTERHWRPILDAIDAQQ